VFLIPGPERKVRIVNKARIGAVTMAAAAATVLLPAPAHAVDVHTRIVNVSSGKCLSIPGRNPNPGAVAAQWSCLPPSQGPDHIWTLGERSGGYWIDNDQTGKCLVESAPSAGSFVVQQECNVNDPNQLWSIDVVGNNVYRYRNRGGRCLAIQERNTDDGAKAFVWGCGQTSGDQWRRAAP
jgi:hypothetical protein